MNAATLHASFDKIFNTPVIKFVVGNNEKEVMIHTVLVAEQSWAFKRLLGGSMEEGQNKIVIWKNIDEQTFALFAEFVYTGGYTPNDGEINGTGSDIGCPYLIDSITDKPEQSSTKVKGSISKAVHEKNRTEFRDLIYGSPATSTTPPTPARSLRNPADKSPRDYSNDNFLGTRLHARRVVRRKETQVTCASKATC